MFALDYQCCEMEHNSYFFDFFRSSCLCYVIRQTWGWFR